MIQIVKKKKPNSKKIKQLRETNNLSQEDFLSRMKEDLGYTMSRRTYQRIEKGDDVQPKYLDYIIKFYDKKNIKLNIDELVLDNNKKKIVNKKTKSPAEKIIQTYDYQKVYLYKVNHFEDVSKLITKSSRRKFFYPLTINSSNITSWRELGVIYTSEKDVVKRMVSMIGDFGKKHLNNKNQIAREKYDNADLEFDLIDIVSDFGEFLKFLNSQGVNLYAANFNLAQFGVEAVDPHPYNDLFKYGVYDKVITIFCFKRDNEQDLNFNYENFWHREKLEQLLKKHKMDNFEKNQFEWGDPEINDEIQAFEESIKYFDGIDTSKVTFDHRVPFTNDDFGYEPDGRDLAEMNNYKDEDESF
ncbi:hypothetical protein ACIJYE_05140 [Candidatus Pelagibacter bacterium nBUS_30]|uniref:hypothetical protein n=1 Tax=Candidatus Pelagibacter bacterium nBUS_30 TaxID=3374191 RepID=UPI003EBA186C